MGPVAQSVERLATGWTVRGSNPGGGEIFHTCPDRPWGPPSLLYNGYRVFPGGKERPGRDADPSPLLAPWSRKSRAIPLLPLWAVRPVQSLSACTRVHCTFPFFLSKTGHGTFSYTQWTTRLYGLEIFCEVTQRRVVLPTFRDNISVPYTRVEKDGTDRPSSHIGNYEPTLLTWSDN